MSLPQDRPINNCRIVVEIRNLRSPQHEKEFPESEWRM